MERARDSKETNKEGTMIRNILFGTRALPGQMRQRLGRICLSVAWVILLFPLAAVYAQTNVSGTITEDTTWTLAGSPYIVTSDITVGNPSYIGATLTIEPGVEVRFEPGTGLFIGDDTGYGALSAQGTEESPIIFTSNAASPSPGDWKGILIDGTNQWGSNLCTDGSCQASDSYSDSLGCSNAFDGNLSSYYHSKSSPSTHWLGYDFGPGNAHKVQRIRIYQLSGNSAADFVVEGSNSTDANWDDRTWTTLATVSDGHGGWHTIDFHNDTAYRFVRVRSTGGY